MKRRRGFTLVEMVVVISVSSMLLGLSVVLVYALLRTEGAARDHVRSTVVLGRLADQFRRDVRQSVRINVMGEQSGRARELVLADRTVVYAFQPGQIVRTEAEGNVRRDESFVLPSQAIARIEVPEAPRPAMACLIVETPGQPAGRVLCIEAAVGQDLRFERN